MSTTTVSQLAAGAPPAIFRPGAYVTAVVGPPVRLVPPPERELLDWPPSWERTVVAAGLDRESRERSRRMTNRSHAMLQRLPINFYRELSDFFLELPPGRSSRRAGPPTGGLIDPECDDPDRELAGDALDELTKCPRNCHVRKDGPTPALPAEPTPDRLKVKNLEWDDYCQDGADPFPDGEGRTVSDATRRSDRRPTRHHPPCPSGPEKKPVRFFRSSE